MPKAYLEEKKVFSYILIAELNSVSLKIYQD